MLTRTFCLVVLTAQLFATRPLAADEDEFDAGQLVGSWTYVLGEKDGARLDKDHFAGQVVEITKESFTLKSDEVFVMTYDLDGEKKPTRVKFEITESPFGAGATSEGILALKNGELKLCYAPMGGAVPSKFEAKAGSGHHFFVLKRVEQQLTADALVGDWKYVSGNKNGESLGKDHFSGEVVEITKNSFTLKGEETFEMEYDLDTQQQPASIKLKITKGPYGEGETAAGILQLKDGELSVCYHPMGGASPRDFVAQEGSGHFLFVLQRSDPK